jgi:hypothetical protein
VVLSALFESVFGFFTPQGVIPADGQQESHGYLIRFKAKAHKNDKKGTKGPLLSPETFKYRLGRFVAFSGSKAKQEKLSELVVTWFTKTATELASAMPDAQYLNRSYFHRKKTKKTLAHYVGGTDALFGNEKVVEAPCTPEVKEKRAWDLLCALMVYHGGLLTEKAVSVVMDKCAAHRNLTAQSSMPMLLKEVLDALAEVSSYGVAVATPIDAVEGCALCEALKNVDEDAGQSLGYTLKSTLHNYGDMKRQLEDFLDASDTKRMSQLLVPSALEKGIADRCGAKTQAAAAKSCPPSHGTDGATSSGTKESKRAKSVKDEDDLVDLGKLSSDEEEYDEEGDEEEDEEEYDEEEYDEYDEEEDDEDPFRLLGLSRDQVEAAVLAASRAAARAFLSKLYEKPKGEKRKWQSGQERKGEKRKWQSGQEHTAKRHWMNARHGGRNMR